jgi:uridine kinase
MKSILIAIVGGSGAGKTWLAGKLERKLSGTSRLSQDDFYRDHSHLSATRRERLNFDHPRAIDWELLEETLDQVQKRGTVLVPCYDFATHCRRTESKKIQAGEFLLIDGLWLLRRPSLRRRFHLSIFIECPAKVRLRRRLERDLAERGRTERSVRKQFAATVEPMHRQFVEPQKRWADIILKPGYGEEQIAEIARACLAGG